MFFDPETETLPQIKHLRNKKIRRKCDIFTSVPSPNDAFSNFYQIINSTKEKTFIKKWIDTHIKNMPKKQDTKAECLRNDGNKFFIKADYSDALRLYTKSLCFATFNGPDYGKALANRAAALFSLCKYEECLKDIENCLKSEYPIELRHKVQLRQLQCYYELKMDDEFLANVHDLCDKFKGNATFEGLVKGNKTRTAKNANRFKKIPKSALTFNENFAFATNSVKLCNLSESRTGRAVIATKKIKAGNVLFREKAFIATPMFLTKEVDFPEICYHCLKHILFTNLPCETCTYCLYCSDRCKKISWSLGHRFECPGMNILFASGLGLPAFKCVMKGILSGFNEAPSAPIEHFGDYVDNYPYVNSLATHFDERHDKTGLCTTAYYIVSYLKHHTDFFTYIRARVERTKQEDVHELVGGLLVKHMAQLIFNGTDLDCSHGFAVAFYPSISMMNNSSNSNIFIENDGCIAVVRAANDIRKGSEIVRDCDSDRQVMEIITSKILTQYCIGYDCECEKCISRLVDRFMRM